MKLGIIAAPKEEDFRVAADKGLDFVEFCVNAKGQDKSNRSNVDEFCAMTSTIREWIRKYGVAVGSIGRWGAGWIHPDGSVVEEEIAASIRLMETAAALGCGVFVCGCNYIPELSYYENCTAAIRLFQRLMERGKALGVRIATYNCRSNNFVCEPMAWKIIHGHLKDLGIKYDPSHSIYDGGDYLTETAEWGSRFLHVHIKGSLRIGGRKFDDPPAGLDETDWGQFIAILIARGYDAGLSIEPHSPNWTGERGNRGVDFTIRYLRERMF